jgi:hypothetical protein
MNIEIDMSSAGRSRRYADGCPPIEMQSGVEPALGIARTVANKNDPITSPRSQTLLRLRASRPESIILPSDPSGSVAP